MSRSEVISRGEAIATLMTLPYSVIIEPKFTPLLYNLINNIEPERIEGYEPPNLTEINKLTRTYNLRSYSNITHLDDNKRAVFNHAINALKCFYYGQYNDMMGFIEMSQSANNYFKK